MVRNINTFNALMDTWQDAKNLAQDATEDTDFYESVQDKYMDSMEAKLASLRASLQDFWTNILDTGAINDGINALNLLVQAFSGLADVLGKLGSFTHTGSITTLLGLGGLSAFGINLQKNIKNTRESIFEDYKNEIAKLKEQAEKEGTDFDISSVARPKMFEGWKSSFKQTWKEFKQLGMKETKADGSEQFSSWFAAFKDGFTSLEDGAGLFDKLKSGASSLIGSLTGVGKAFLGIGVAITAIKVGSLILDALGDSSEEAAKKAKDASDAYIQGQKQLQSKRQSLDDVSAEWSELSKGVNLTTNENVSLTNDEYERFLTLNNQIAEVLPNTVSGYDSQGNAITTLTGKIRDLNDAYDQMALKQAKEDLQGFASVQEDLSNKTGNKDWVTQIKDYFSSLGEVIGNGGQSVIGKNVDYKTAVNELKKLKDMSFDEANEYFSLAGSLGDTYNQSVVKSWSRSGQGTGQLEAYVKGNWNEDFWEEQKKEIPTKIQEYEDVIEDATSNYQMMMQDVLKTLTLDKDKYPEFANMDSNLLDSVSVLLNNLPTDKLVEFGQSTSKAKVYLKDLLSTVNDDKDVQNSLSNLLSIKEDTNIEDVRKILNNDLDIVTDALDLDDQGVKDFKVRFGIDGKEELIKQVDDLCDQVDKKESDLAKKDISFAEQPTVVRGVSDETNALYEDYKKVVSEFNDLELQDPTQTVFGNIDTNNRQVLKWTQSNLNAYKDALQSWDTDAANDWQSYAQNMKDSISTVFGKSEDFDGIEIAFSPMLQTDKGAVLLDKDTVNNYINDLMSQLGDDWTKDDLLKLDSQGIKEDGTVIKNLIADIGNTAKQTGEAMQFTGKDGAISEAYEELAAQEDSYKIIDKTVSSQEASSKLYKQEVNNLKKINKQNKYDKNAKKQIGKFIKDNNITTKSQLGLLSKCVDEADNLSEAFAKYKDTSFDVNVNADKLSDLENNLATVKEAISEVNDSWKESMSSSGMQSANIEAVKAAFSDLPSYNYDKLFESTASGVHMNVTELKKLKAEYNNVQKAKYTDTLNEEIEAYQNVCKQIAEATSLSEKQSLIQQKDTLSGQIQQTNELISRYEGLTNAVTQYFQALEQGEEGDVYDQITSGYEKANELWEKGLVGTNEFQSFAQMFSYEDLAGQGSDAYVQAWQNGQAKMKRWLSEGGEGVENFLYDIRSLNKEWANVDANGNWTLDFPDMETMAKSLGVSESLIDSIMKKLNDYGFEIDFSETTDNLKALREQAREANKDFGEFSKFDIDDTDLKKVIKDTETIQKVKDFKFDLDVTDEHALQDQIDTAEQLRKVLVKVYGEDSIQVKNFDKQLNYLKAQKGEMESIAKLAKEGFTLDMDLDKNKKDLEDILDKLNKIKGFKNLKLNLDGSNLKSVNEDITTLKNAISKLQDENGKVDLSKNGASELLELYSGYLNQRSKLKLSQDVIGKRDTSKIKDQNEAEATSIIQSYQKAYEELNNAKDINKQFGEDTIDTISLTKSVNKFVKKIKESSDDVKKAMKKYKIDPSKLGDDNNANIDYINGQIKSYNETVDKNKKSKNTSKSEKSDNTSEKTKSKGKSETTDYSQYNDFASKSTAAFEDVSGQIKAKAKEIWQSISTDFGKAWDSVTKGFSDWGSSIGEALSKAYDTVSEKASAIGKSLQEGFGKAWDNAKQAVQDWYKSISENVSSAVNDVKTKMSDMWNSFKSSDIGQALSHLFDSLGNFGEELWALLGRTFDDIKEKISKSLSETWNSVSQSISDWASGAGEVLQTAWNSVVDGVSDWASPIIKKVSEAWNDVKDSISEWGTNAGGWLEEAWNGAITTLSDWKGSIKQKISEALNGVKEGFDEAKNGFDEAWNSITDTVSSWKDSITEKLDPIVNAVTEWAGNVIDDVKNGLSDSISGGIESIADFFDKATNLIKNSDNLGDLVGTVFDKIKNNIQSKIRELASSLPQWLKDIITKLTGIKLDLPEVNFDGLDLSDDEKEVVVKYIADHSDIDNYTPEEKDAIAKYLADPSALDSFTPEEKEAVARFIAEHGDVDSWTPAQKEALARYLKETSEPDNYKPANKTATAKYKKNSTEVDNYNPPNLTRTVTFFASVKKAASDLWGKITGAGSVDGTAHIQGTAHANGTTHISGTAYANGTTGDWGVKEDETSLVGELGPELRVRKDGKWDLLGEKGAQFAQIHRGEIIFNHIQTKELFENGYVTSGKGRGKAFVNGTVTKLNNLFKIGNGTAYANGSYSGGGHFVKNSKFYSNAKVSQGSTKAAKEASEASKDFKESLDWIEVMIDRLEREIDKLDTIASSAYKNFTTRNKTLADEFSKVTQEIELQQKAYDAYMNKANSIGLSADYMDKIKNGRLEIEDITDETTNDRISEAQGWVDKAYDARDAINDLNEKLGELVKTNFDNINDEFSSQLEIIEHENNLLETQLDIIEGKGMFAGQNYYTALMANEEKYIEKLHDQYMDLSQAMYDALDSGAIVENSEAWYEMQKEINSVSEAYAEAKKQLVDYKNEAFDMRESIFEKGMEYFSDITDESNFLQDILRVGDNDVFVKKSGRLNDNGNTINALHAMNYDAYMAQADKYKEKINELNEEIAKDPTNTKLIDKRNEYIQQQREMIQNANEEKKSIHDLIEESYNKMLDILQKLIDKRKDLLEAQKDLYDYEKEVSEKTKNITDIQKQIWALNGDDSEETSAKKQQLSSDLKDAQSDLEETEFEKFIDDQNQLWSSLYDQYESILNERLDNIDGLLQDVIDYGNQNSDKVNQTITDATDKVSYTLSEGMQSIWNSTDSGVGKILSDYSENFLSSMSTVTEYLLYIFHKMGGKTKEEVEQDRLKAEAEKKRQEELKRKQQEEEAKKQQEQQAKQNSVGQDTIAGIAAAIWCESNSGWGNDPFRSGKLQQKIGADNARKVQEYINAHGYNGDLWRYWANNLGYNASKYHYNAFDTGGYTGTGEGFAMLHAKERVLNASQTKAFEQLVYSFLPQISEELGKVNDLKSNASAIYGRGNNSTVENSIDLTLNLPNVTDANDFVKTLQTDKNVQKIIKSFTIDEAMGKNTLRKFNIK